MLLLLLLLLLTTAASTLHTTFAIGICLLQWLHARRHCPAYKVVRKF
jgi:hypothetical protein